jgi:glycosyltransferase involved in cell wall biosynthesis
MKEKKQDISGIKEKRILFIVQLPPPIHGASIMNKHIVSSGIIKGEFITEVINLQFAKSVDELTKFSFLKVFKAMQYSFLIIRKSLFFRPSIVYLTLSPVGYAFYRDSIFVFLLKLFNKNIVYHLHGKGIKENARNSLFKKILYRSVFQNTKVICLSQRLTNDISEVYDQKPYIVANGIQIQPAITEKISQSSEKIPQILYLSNYIRDKGVLTLIDALSKLKDHGHKFNARLVGAPSDLKLDFLKELIKAQNLENCIQILGPLYGDEKNYEFCNADIFCFPTYYRNEAFPLVILEAMQFSLPVISTYEGGIPDIVIEGETGFLVEAQNPEMLAGKIAVLLTNRRLITEMGKKGRERFNSNFTLNHFEMNMNSTFNSILGSELLK